MLLLQRLLASALAEGGIGAGNSAPRRILALLLGLGSIDVVLASGDLVHDLIVDVGLPFKVFVTVRALESISILFGSIQLIIETSDAPREIIKLLLRVRDVLLALLIIVDDFVFQGFGEESFEGIDV